MTGQNDRYPYPTRGEVADLIAASGGGGGGGGGAPIDDSTTSTSRTWSSSKTSSGLASKADLVSGVVPVAQIPAIAVIDFLGTTANQAAMLALTGQKGDWTIRTDLGTTWIITGNDPTQLTSWTALSYPTAPVQTVAGKTGAVTLVKSDVGLDQVSNTADTDKPVSSAQQTALDAKALVTRVAVAPTGAAGFFDPLRSIYNAKASQFRILRARLARASNSIVPVAFLGDSETAGVGADPATTSWPRQLMARLAATGITWAGDLVTTAGNTRVDSRWSFSGTSGGDWTLISPVTANCYRQSVVNGATATFTSNQPGTDCTFYYWDNGSTSFTYSVDGASAITITKTNSGTLKKVTFSGLTNTTHSIVFTNGSTTALRVVAAGFHAATGVLLINAGISSAQASDWGQSGYVLDNILLMYAFVHVYMLGVNDAAQGVTQAAYTSSMQTAITKSINGGAQVLLATSFPAQSIDISTTRTALYNLATSNDLPLLDILDRWGSYAAFNAGTYSDSVHPNAIGYFDAARAFEALFGNVGAVSSTELLWTAPTLASGFANFGSGYSPAGYRKNADGLVTVRGVVSVTNSGTVFTLPSGYRPSGNLLFPSISNSMFASLGVNADGTVTVSGVMNTWVSLNCSFYVS